MPVFSSYTGFFIYTKPQMNLNYLIENETPLQFIFSKNYNLPVTICFTNHHFVPLMIYSSLIQYFNYLVYDIKND